MLRKLFLPIGIVLSIAVAFVWPEPGIGFKALRWGSWFTANNVMILIVFFICGWNVDAGSVRYDRRFAMLSHFRLGT